MTTPNTQVAVVEPAAAPAPYTPTESLTAAEFKNRRDALMRFIGAQLMKGEVKNGKLIAVNDYYEVPGGNGQLALSKKGAELLNQHYRLVVAESRVVDQVLQADFVSVRSRCALHRQGVIVGEKEAAANTAEKAFQSPWARMKYGAQWSWKQDERGKRVPDKETVLPDFRAAQHEIVMKSQKRAFVGATIVALAASDILAAADALDIDALEDVTDDTDATESAQSVGAPTAEQITRLFGLMAHPLLIADDERSETAKWLSTPQATARTVDKLIAKLEARMVGA